MHLSQVYDQSGSLKVVARNGNEAYVVEGVSSVYQLASEAIQCGKTIGEQIGSSRLGAAIDLDKAADENRFAVPIHHADPSHTFVTGTGLTHLGSASTRDNMHSNEDVEKNQTDTMKMFQWGIEGGKPAGNSIGVTPEWFYKGNGQTIVAPGTDIVSPNFAKDAGEEPEIAGIYINSEQGVPHRIGFAIANEFSDHIIEKANYLYLAHSKLRQSSIGPEIYVGDFPDNITGSSAIIRNGETIWQKEFLSGTANMSHSIQNLEHHHFKYDLFRNPGDVHIHMFGTATLSFADGMTVQDGDEFKISAQELGRALRNRVSISREPERKFQVGVL